MKIVFGFSGIKSEIKYVFKGVEVQISNSASSKFPSQSACLVLTFSCNFFETFFLRSNSLFAKASSCSNINEEKTLAVLQKELCKSKRRDFMRSRSVDDSYTPN